MAYANGPYLFLKAIVIVILGLIHLTCHKYILNAFSMLKASEIKHYVSKGSLYILYLHCYLLLKISTVSKR